MKKAKESASEEKKLAEEAKTRVTKEEQEASAAETAYLDNQASIKAAADNISSLKAERTSLNSSIKDQKDRYVDLKKDEIKAEKKNKPEES